MAGHKCNQEGTIKEMQRSITDSEKRDILQSEQILTMQKDIGEVKTDIKTILQKIDNLENKFASKRVERVIKGLVGITLVTVLGAILAKIIVQ